MNAKMPAMAYSPSVDECRTEPRHGLAVCGSVATMMVSVHPSLQSAFLDAGIPSFLVAIVFFVPVAWWLASQGTWNSRQLRVTLAIVAYCLWLCLTSFYSPGLGTDDFYASLRGLLVLAPLAVCCALCGAQAPRRLCLCIVAVAGSVLAHYLVLVLASESISAEQGFRSLSTHAEQNYQATSFYLGIVGLASVTAILMARRLLFWLGLAALPLVLYSMATVGARASLVALCLTVAFQLFLASARRWISVVSVGGCLFLAAGLLWGEAIFALLEEKFVVVDRLVALFDGSDPSHRMRLFLAAIQMWLHSAGNFVFGGGLAAYPVFIGESEPGWYPHNFVLESLAEGGVIAGLLMLAILAMFVAQVFRMKTASRRKSDYFLAALAFYALVSYQFMGGIQSIWIPLYFVSIFLFSSVSGGGPK